MAGEQVQQIELAAGQLDLARRSTAAVAPRRVDGHRPEAHDGRRRPTTWRRLRAAHGASARGPAPPAPARRTAWSGSRRRRSRGRAPCRIRRAARSAAAPARAGVGAAATQGAQHGHAVEAGQHEVEDDQVERLARSQPQRLLPVAGLSHRPAIEAAGAGATSSRMFASSSTTRTRRLVSPSLTVAASLHLTPTSEGQSNPRQTRHLTVPQIFHICAMALTTASRPTGQMVGTTVLSGAEVRAKVLPGAQVLRRT